MLIGRKDRGLVAEWWFTVDVSLLAAVFLLMAMGVLASMAASPPVALRLGYSYFHFFFYQMVYLVPSIILFLGLSMATPTLIRSLAWIGFCGALIAIVGALMFGPEIKGAHRWLFFAGVGVQPSEFAKPCFVVCVAWLLGYSLKKKNHFGLWASWGVYVLLTSLLLRQPDVGQTVLVSAVFCLMLFIYGVCWRWFLTFGVGGIALLAGAFFTFPHVHTRIMRFLNPESGDNFQVETAVRAISGGGFFGTGPGGGTAKTILPDAHTDFIAAVIVEEFGLMACLVLLLVLGFIILRSTLRAQREPNPTLALAQVGLVGVFAFQAMINLGVNAALLPAKGMTLPFISYGGSSLLACSLTMGMLLALGRKRPDMHWLVGL